MEQTQIEHQILFMRSAKNPNPRWVIRSDDGFIRLTENRVEAWIFTSQTLPAAKADALTLFKKEACDKWMRIVPTTTTNAEVAAMVKDWQDGGAGETPAPAPTTPDLVWNVPTPHIKLDGFIYDWHVIVEDGKTKVWRTIETPRGKYWQVATREVSKVFWQSPADIALDTGKSTECLANGKGHKRPVVEDLIRTHFNAYEGEEVA